MTLAEQLNYSALVDALDAPPEIEKAARQVIAAGDNPPLDLIQYVQSWMGKQAAQNRYGK